MRSDVLPALMSATAVLGGGAFIVPSAQFGPVSEFMAMHIVIMNVAAPVFAIALVHVPRSVTVRPFLLWVSAGLQGLFLLLWHLPSFHAAAMGSVLIESTMTALLVFSASYFWLLVLRAGVIAPWQAMLVLMITGKVACLVGGILLFAPRNLYAATLHGMHPFGMLGLEDQQLAGLLMISVCPLSYVIAGVVIAAQMLLRLEKPTGQDRPSGTRQLLTR